MNLCHRTPSPTSTAAPEGHRALAPASSRRERRRGAGRLWLGLAAALLGSLLLAPAAMAKDESFGYTADEPLSGTMCAAGQTCTAYASEGGQYGVPVAGWITEFTVDHSVAGGSGQTVRLLVIDESTRTVEASYTPTEALSTSPAEEVQTFKIPLADQPAVERGQTLALTVIPSGSEKADNVIADGGGVVEECVSGPSAKGEAIEHCGELGSYAHLTSVDAVRAHVEDFVAQPEIVSYPPATNISATSAELHARIKADDPGGHATAARFEYGTVDSEAGLNQLSPEAQVQSGEPGEQEFNQSIGGLKPNTTYYYRVGVSNYEAASNSGWEYGYEAGNYREIKSFTTPSAPAPSVALGATTNVGQTTATLNGAVASNWFATRWKFEYGESVGYGAATAEGEVGSGSGTAAQAVSSNVTGLKPNTLYHYRLFAANAGGATQSADGTFRTASGSPPALAGFAFSGLSPWEVVLSFTVDPEGYQTTFQVQWGTSASYGNTDSGGPTNAVFGPQDYDWDAEYALAPGTTYHLRVLATNQWGTTTGPDLTVTTPGFTSQLLVDEFGVLPNNAKVPVNQANPVLVLGKRFSCPPACKVEAEVVAVGRHGKKIKLGTAHFKVPKDKRKHKLEVKLSKTAKRLLAKRHHLHLKVKYKIAGEKGNSTTIVSALTLTASGRHGRRKRG
jgi:hypothetical protein